MKQLKYYIKLYDISRVIDLDQKRNMEACYLEGNSELYLFQQICRKFKGIGMPVNTEF